MATMREQQFNAATGAMGVSEQDLPLAFRMMEHIPGIAAGAGFMAHRGSNTLISGGRFDYMNPSAGGRAGRKAQRLQQRFRVFDSAGQMSGIHRAQFVGGATGLRGGQGRGILGRRLASRAQRKTASASASTGLKSFTGASNFSARAFRANFLTGKPSALNRMHSMSIFAPASMGAYSPYAASTLASKGKFGNYAAGKMGLTPTAGENFFGPGMLSFITAGTKIDRLEKKVLSGNQKAISKLARLDDNIKFLGGMNNPAMFAPQEIKSTIRRDLTTNLRAPKGGAYVNGKFYKGGRFLPGFDAPLEVVSKPTGWQRLRVRPGQTLEFGGKTYQGAVKGIPGLKGNFVPNAARFVDTELVTGYGASFYDDAMKGAVVGPGKAPVGIRGNLMASSMHGQGSRYVAGYFRGAMGYSQIAGLEGAAKVGADKAAAHLAGKGATKYMAHGAKALGFAMPGLNVLLTASLVYDLGKMAGEVVKSGINLARDANKSLQGSINKPLFGMGYKDTEAAATSRARGVMAIQNSRLNARSMLGSEASMLAAHYG